LNNTLKTAFEKMTKAIFFKKKLMQKKKKTERSRQNTAQVVSWKNTQMQKTPDNARRSGKRTNEVTTVYYTANPDKIQHNHDRARTRRGIGVHPALASTILFRFVPSEPAVLLVGMPLTEFCSPPLLLLALAAVMESRDELGDLGTSLRRGLVGVDGPAAAAAGATEVAEVVGGLLTRPLPVFTGVPDVIAESPSRRTRRDFAVVDTGADVLAGAAGPLSASAFSGAWRLLADAFFSERLAPERAREEAPSTLALLPSPATLASTSAPEEVRLETSPSYSTIRSSFQVTFLRDLDVALRLPEVLRSARP
jgi:hypothetical protein